MNGSVQFKAGRWWLTLAHELPDPPPKAGSACSHPKRVDIWPPCFSAEVIPHAPLRGGGSSNSSRTFGNMVADIDHIHP